MALKIFLTGATGYVGGEVLHQLYNLPDKHAIRCLVRSGEKAARIEKVMPGVVAIQGDLNDANLIAHEAAIADVVFHLADTRHETSSRAIANGLSGKTDNRPGYWLQMGGGAVLAVDEISSHRFGQASDKIYDDIKDMQKVISLIKADTSHVVNNLVLAQDPSQIRTALVLGPLIYGEGRGPGNTTTIQAPMIADYTLSNGESFYINQGQNIWSTIHVLDVGRFFVRLLEATVKGQDDVWNENGIFLIENGEIRYDDLARQISGAAIDQKLITSDKIRSLSAGEVDRAMPHGSRYLGTNVRLSSSKANRTLRWQPAGCSLAEDVPMMVKRWAARMEK